MILPDVKKSIKSVSSPIQFLPNISDILSEITDVVSSVQESPSNASHNSSEAVDLRQLLLFPISNEYIKI